MWRFFRTPKGVLTIILGVLLAVSVPAAGVRTVMPVLLAATAAAVLLDLFILRMRGGRWEFPSGALLTALIAVMVLSPQEPWHVAAITAAVSYTHLTLPTSDLV